MFFSVLDFTRCTRRKLRQWSEGHFGTSKKTARNFNLRALENDFMADENEGVLLHQHGEFHIGVAGHHGRVHHLLEHIKWQITIGLH